MIYKRNANFPYPLLTNDSSAYKDNTFVFDCDMDKNNEYYIFTVKCEIHSHFIRYLLKSKFASLYLIVHSADSHFYELDYKYDGQLMTVKVSIKDISIMRNTNLQLIIKANMNLTFANNNDLDEFYDEYKKEINIIKGNALGFSNIVTFNGSMRKPFVLFEKRIDPNLSSDIAFDLSGEFITIVYKKEEYEFNDLSNSRNLNNMYLYLGLQKALLQFIRNHPDDTISISDILPSDNNLDNKLLLLMQSKGVDEVNEDNIDEVIKKISDNLLDKFNYAVRGLNDGN